MNDRYYITFYSHYAAMIFKKEMQQENKKVKLMPVPRLISSSCGTCAMVEDNNFRISNIDNFEDIENVYKLIDNQLINIERE